jgi:neutral amino acid transport system ATP-binding protein
MSADLAASLGGVPAEPGVAKPNPVLMVDEVHKSFGGLVAVDIAHLEVQRGIITALIGPNGAGKTTFFNVVTGFERPDRGRWAFDGRPVSGRPAHQIARRGMVRTFQLTKALVKMSVIDNMTLAASGQRGERFVNALAPGLWRHQEARIERRAEELLERFQLTHMRDEYAAALSGGQRKLLELARALMCEPRMLLLDEPVAGVNPVLRGTILDHVRRLRDAGVTIVLVEHDMDVVMGISEWVVCMAGGRIIAEGPPRSIARNRAVIDAYLGARHDEPGEGGDAA